MATAFAPGRVNLIGEHTDYNDGLCLPFAVDLGVTVTAEPSGGRVTEVHARDLGERDAFERPAPAPGWRAYVRGTAAVLADAGFTPPPCRLEITGDLPRGAGLSSSAALCVATALALLAASGTAPPEPLELARLCSRVEHEWAGARTGLLDQLASLLGRERHALRIDMRDHSVRPVPLELGDWRLATLDSGAPRALAASGYNRRRDECAAACERLGIDSLRGADPEAAAALPEPLNRRARHVFAENQRVDRACRALERGDLAELGALLHASHRSLRDDYQVSTPDVERAVDACNEAGAAGARIMGGGFGGAVLALFPPGAEPPPGALAVTPGEGARLL